MAITRVKKEELVTKTTDAFARSKMTVLANYQGLSVKEMQELRRKLRAEGADIKVVKNNLVKIALDANDQLKDVDRALFNGPVALIFGYKDEVAPAQVAVNYSKEHNALEMLAAFNAQGEQFDQAQVARLASLPSKDQLRAMVVGTIAAPLSGFANVLAGNIRGLVNVMNGLAEQKGEATVAGQATN